MEAETAAGEEAARLIATPGLQQLLDRFAQEHFLRFEEPVANLFEFLTSNTIRSNRKNGVVAQPVGIYIGPKADSIIAVRTLFLGDVQKAIIDESQGGHNQLTPPYGQ